MCLLLQALLRTEAELDPRALTAKPKHYFHLFLQYKRETLKTTKYVELVIVADNREVRNLKLPSCGKCGRRRAARFSHHGIASNVLQTGV